MDNDNKYNNFDQHRTCMVLLSINKNRITKHKRQTFADFNNIEIYGELKLPDQLKFFVQLATSRNIVQSVGYGISLIRRLLPTMSRESMNP